MDVKIPRFSGHHMNRRGPALAAIVVLAAVLQVAAAAGLSYVAGWGAVKAAFAQFDWWWVCACVGGVVVSFVGYHFAYRGIFRVDGGPDLGLRQMLAAEAAGFGGFLAHGGAALDEFALKGAGAEDRDATVRVTALGGLEHGILALGTTGAAIAVLVLGRSLPPSDFSVPWAVIPVPGFLVAFWLAERYRARFNGARGGWRAKLGVFLDSIHLIRAMFINPRRHGSALLGMGLFWAADAFAAWAGLAAFGFRMHVASFIVGYATGMVFTRRTGPLAGAGVLMLVLPLTIWYSGAPLASAVAGVFAYRVISLWLPMPFSFAALPALRSIGHERQPGAEGAAYPPDEPALRQKPSEERQS